VDSRALAQAARPFEDVGRRPPKAVKDYRRILDDKGVDALFVATPDHWHALPTIHACQAGKDVYVEKPASHNVWEGRQMVNAARRYGRVVQAGTQTRSAPYAAAAREYLRRGKLGEIHLCRVYNMKGRGELPPRADEKAPAEVDYDMWLGPAPSRNFNPNRFHGGWYWHWDYSGGDIVCDAIHQIDLARMLVEKEYPKSCTGTGGRLHFEDAAEAPDTQVVTWEFDGLVMTLDLTLYTPYMVKTTMEMRDSETFPYWPQNSTRIELYGALGLMVFGRHGDGWQAFGPEGRIVDEQQGREPTPGHLDDFFDRVRDRGRPAADIEECHRSTILAHLGNISCRLGGRRLQFDAAREEIVGDEEAALLAKRVGREPYRIPEVSL
jgi:predicted dehydrogenase